MSEASLLYLLFLGINGISLSLVRPRVGYKRRRWFPTPSFMFVFFYILYTSAEPLNLWLTGDAPDPDLPGFLHVNLLASSGLLLGIIGARALMGKEWVSAPLGEELLARRSAMRVNTLVLIILPLSVYFACMYVRLAMLGFSLSSIFLPYNSEGDMVGEFNLAQTLSGFGVISSILFGIFVEYFLPNPHRRKLLYMWLIIGLLTFGYFLARGNRNFGTMLLLPVLTMFLSRRPIRLTLALAGVLVFYIFFQFLAYARNFGLNDLGAMSGIMTAREFSPSGSELGTSFNVYRKFQEIAVYFDAGMGRSYSIDALINLIPRGIWPDRPYTLSEKFVRVYLATDEVTEGFGFSPLIEAWVNFDYYGCPFVFAAFGLLVAFLDRWLRMRPTLSGILGWSVLVPFVVNWNRIDFATCLKMYLIFICFFVFFEKMTIRRLKSKRGLEQDDNRSSQQSVAV